jgi:phosphate starvation-inducible protein PhoH and related proteins
MGRRRRRSDEDYQFEEQLPYEKTQYAKVKPFRPKTEAQSQAHSIVKENTLTFLGGPAGTGKTLIPCQMALDDLANNKVKKIIITRPNVEAGKSLGYLPGSAEEKLFHYLVPIYDNLEIFIGKEKLAQLLEEEVIQCVPIGFMRGRTLNDAFIIIDEAQNMTREQLRMVLTRIGFGSRAVVTYDTEQIDIRKSDSCVLDIPLFEGHNNIGHFTFSPNDVVRSEIVKTIIQVYLEAQEANEEEIRGRIL